MFRGSRSVHNEPRHKTHYPHGILIIKYELVLALSPRLAWLITSSASHHFSCMLSHRHFLWFVEREKRDALMQGMKGH